jgi:hypothetical protein
MARVNVEQKALTDARFGRLGLLLVQHEYPEITIDTAQCLGVGRMVKLWNECQERNTYTLTDHDLVVLLAHRDAPSILISCGLGERFKRGVVRIKGTTDRIEWLAKARQNGQLGAEHGAKGGRPKVTPHETPEKPPEGLAEKPPPTPTPTPTPAVTGKQVVRGSTSPSEKKVKSARDLVEELVLDDELREYARKRGLDPDDVFEDWRLHYRGNGYKTTAGPVKDARATFMRWCRTGQQIAARQASFARPNPNAGAPVRRFQFAPEKPE